MAICIGKMMMNPLGFQAFPQITDKPGSNFARQARLAHRRQLVPYSSTYPHRDSSQAKRDGTKTWFCMKTGCQQKCPTCPSSRRLQNHCRTPTLQHTWPSGETAQTRLSTDWKGWRDCSRVIRMFTASGEKSNVKIFNGRRRFAKSNQATLKTQWLSLW